MNRRLSHRVAPLVVGTVVIMLLGSQALAQPATSASLYQSGGWSSAAGPSAASRFAPRLTTTDSSSYWTCDVWARSSADWLVAEAQAALFVDGRIVAAYTFYPNFWGATGSTGATVEAGLEPRYIYCEAYVSDLYGSANDGVGATLPARAPTDLRSVPPDQWTYTAPGRLPAEADMGDLG